MVAGALLVFPALRVAAHGVCVVFIARGGVAAVALVAIAGVARRRRVLRALFLATGAATGKSAAAGAGDSRRIEAASCCSRSKSITLMLNRAVWLRIAS